MPTQAWAWHLYKNLRGSNFLIRANPSNPRHPCSMQLLAFRFYQLPHEAMHAADFSAVDRLAQQLIT